MGDRLSVSLNTVKRARISEADSVNQKEAGADGALNLEAVRADIVQGLVVEHDCNVGILKERVGGEYGVVGLNHGGGDLWGADGGGELGLFAVIEVDSLEEEGADYRADSAIKCVDGEETLETSSLVGELANTVEVQAKELLSDYVVATFEDFGGVHLVGDEQPEEEGLAEGAYVEIIDDGGLQTEIEVWHWFWRFGCGVDSLTTCRNSVLPQESLRSLILESLNKFEEQTLIFELEPGFLRVEPHVS
jgi:hypothetical protein